MEELLSIIKELKGCQFGIMTYETECPAKKCVYWKLGCRSIRIIVEEWGLQFGAVYENAVNNHIKAYTENEPNFESYSLPFGVWVDGQVSKLISYNGELYLRYYKTRSSAIQSVSYVIDGRSATPDEIKLITSHLKLGGSSVRQEKFGLYGDKQVYPKVIKLSNIKKLKINGKEFSL